MPYFHQCLHLVQQDGFVAELHEGFWDAQGERSQSGPVPPHQDQSLHDSAVTNSYLSSSITRCWCPEKTRFTFIIKIRHFLKERQKKKISHACFCVGFKIKSDFQIQSLFYFEENYSLSLWPLNVNFFALLKYKNITFMYTWEWRRCDRGQKYK